MRAVLWLEEYLTRWKKTLVVVSHDREFLNTVCTDIIHLHDLKLTSYRGNFASFEEMYDQRRREANKAAEKHEKALKAAKASGSKQKIEKVTQGAKAKAEVSDGSILFDFFNSNLTPLPSALLVVTTRSLPSRTPPGGGRTTPSRSPSLSPQNSLLPSCLSSMFLFSTLGERTSD